MPVAELCGLRIGYDTFGGADAAGGRGSRGRPAVVVCNGLGADRSSTADLAGWLAPIAGGPPSSAEGFGDHARACAAHDALGRLAEAAAAGGPLASVPTLVTWGSHDLVCRPVHGEELAAALPHAGTRVWQGSGLTARTSSNARAKR